MGALFCGEDRKRHIGVFLHMKPSEGGSFQYEEFVMNALAECAEEYRITVVYDDMNWDEKIYRKYPALERKHVQFNYDKMYDEVDSLGLDYLIVPSYGPDHCFEVRFQTPLIAVFHDFMYYYEPQGKMCDDRKFSYLLQAICFRSVGVFVDSDLGKKHCLEVLGHMYEEKVVSVPFRVPDYLLEDEEKNVSLKAEKYIFYPAQLWPHKNQLNLILAVDMLKQQGVFVNLVFTGAHSGIYEYIMHLIHKLKLEEQVEILDYVDGAEMKFLFHHARAMLMAAYTGPTNIPPIEAMLCGCPVAVADVYAMPWQIGDAGLCFNPKSVEDIADTLKSLWTDDELCRELSRRGKIRAKKFSKEEFNRKFRDGMRHLLSRYESRYENLQALAKKCREYENLYLYGAGAFGAMICNYLSRNGIVLDGFIVTHCENNQKTWYGYPVYSLDEIKKRLTDAYVLISVYHRNQAAIMRNMNGISVRGIHFITDKEWAEAYTYFVMEN